MTGWRVACASAGQSFKNYISLNHYWHGFSQQLRHKWLSHSRKKTPKWLQRAYYDQLKKFPWYRLSKCFVLFIMCVVTYGFQMELTAAKRNHEARQYLRSEPDIIFFPSLCFSASPLSEFDIKIVLDLMFCCFRPGHWHALQSCTCSFLFVCHIFFRIMSNL